MKNIRGTCEIIWCQKEGVPTIYVNETLEDNCYNVQVCKDCAEILDIKEGGELTEVKKENIDKLIEVITA